MHIILYRKLNFMFLDAHSKVKSLKYTTVMTKYTYSDHKISESWIAH